MTSAMKDSQNQAGVPSQSANRNSMLISLDMPSAPPFGSALDRQLYGISGRAPAAATAAKIAASARRAAPSPQALVSSAAAGGTGRRRAGVPRAARRRRAGDGAGSEIGRASCRARVGKYV